MKIYKWRDILFTLTINMQKRIKITLYVILILAIIAVAWLMFGNTNLKTKNPQSIDIEVQTWDNLEEYSETTSNENPSFEEDVMKDLEWFFNNSNWYENVEWEFWFINADEE